ncbi:MAG: flagellar FlbD family protein [Bryobacterales bacterium]|nr:flagellar FlbD family protein [Bryobacterales bacterium]
MIRVTRLNAESIFLNSDLIEFVESTPDTVLRLTSGQRLMVRESPEEIVSRIIQFRRAVTSPDTPATLAPGERNGIKHA